MKGGDFMRRVEAIELSDEYQITRMVSEGSPVKPIVVRNSRFPEVSGRTERPLTSAIEERPLQQVKP